MFIAQLVQLRLDIIRELRKREKLTYNDIYNFRTGGQMTYRRDEIWDAMNELRNQGIIDVEITEEDTGGFTVSM